MDLDSSGNLAVSGEYTHSQATPVPMAHALTRPTTSPPSPITVPHHRCAGASDGQLVIHDLRIGEAVAEWSCSDDDDPVVAVKWCVNGGVLACSQSSLRLYDADGNTLSEAAEGAGGDFTALAVTGSSTVVTGNTEGAVVKWDLTSLEEGPTSLDATQAAVTCLCPFATRDTGAPRVLAGNSHGACRVVAVV